MFSSALLLVQLVVVFNLRHINFNKTMIFCSLNLNVKKSELFLTDICLRSWKSLPSVRVNEVLQQLHVSEKESINIVDQTNSCIIIAMIININITITNNTINNNIIIFTAPGTVTIMISPVVQDQIFISAYRTRASS